MMLVMEAKGCLNWTTSTNLCCHWDAHDDDDKDDDDNDGDGGDDDSDNSDNHDVDEKDQQSEDVCEPYFLPRRLF